MADSSEFCKQLEQLSEVNECNRVQVFCKDGSQYMVSKKSKCDFSETILKCVAKHNGTSVLIIFDNGVHFNLDCNGLTEMPNHIASLCEDLTVAELRCLKPVTVEKLCHLLKSPKGNTKEEMLEDLVEILNCSYEPSCDMFEGHSEFLPSDSDNEIQVQHDPKSASSDNAVLTHLFSAVSISSGSTSTQINVIGLDGVIRDYYLDIKSDTAHDLAVKINMRTAVKTDSFYLTFAEQKLEAANTLQSYGVKAYSIVHMMHAPFRFFVKSLDGKSIPIDAGCQTDIEVVKDFVWAKVGCPKEDQMLTFGGKKLMDGVNLADYNIKKDSVVHLVLKLGGAGKRARAGAERDNAEIPMLFEQPKALSTDIPQVLSAIALSKIEIPGWIMSVGESDMKKL